MQFTCCGGAVLTPARNALLVWFRVVATGDHASGMEDRLKMLCAQKPREIGRMIRGFHDLVREVHLP